MNKWVRRFFYFFASIIVLVLAIFLWLQTDWGKNVVRKKVQSYISTKTNTEFLIGSIDYSLPTWVELNGVLMRDQSKDTLLYGNRIKADIAMLGLLKGKYQVDKILLDNMYVNLTKKDTDSVFNYQFIIDAFKSKAESATQADTATIDLSLKELTLKNVRFNLLDDQTGSYTRMSVKDMHLQLKNLDINTMNFDIDKFYTDELRLELLVKKDFKDTSAIKSQIKLPIVVADSVLIKNSYISFIDEINKVKSINSIGQLQLAGFSNKENANVLKGKYIQLANSNIAFDHVIAATKPAVVLTNDSVIVTDNLAFLVDEIDLQNNQIKYNNNAALVKINGLDYAHLAISGLNLKATENEFRNGAIRSTIQGFSFRDKSGFQLDSLRGFISMDSGNVRIQNLYVKTPTSTIEANAMIYPLSFTANNGTSPQGFPQNTIILTNTLVSKKDLDLLAESITTKYSRQMNALGDLRIDANMVGNARQMLINDLNVRSATGSGFVLHVAGTAANVNDLNRLSYNLNIKNLTATKALLNPFLEGNAQPVQLPQVLFVNGTLSGTMNRLLPNLNVSSAYGKARIKGNLINFQDPQKMLYDVQITANDLETGKWIYQDSLLGKLTGTITAKGFNGFDIKKSSIKSTGNVSSFRLDKNVYNNIKFNAVLVKGIADFVASVNDELLRFNVDGKANIKTAYPAINATLNLQKADLFGLGFVKDSLQLSTLAKIDLKNGTPQNLDAIVRLDSLLVTTAGKNIFADSALLVAFVRNDSTIANLVSSLADVNLASNLNYEQMPVLLTEVMANYLSAHNNKPVPRAPRGTIVADMVVKENELYGSFVDDLSFVNVLANFQITNQDRDSAVKGNITAEKIQVGTNKATNLVAGINGTADSLLLVITADTITTGQILLYDALVKAGFDDNNVSGSLLTRDADKRDQFALGFIANQNAATKGYDLKLSEALLLNYKNWQVNPQNQVRTSPEGFNINNFDISNNQQKISLSSNTPAFNAPITVVIDDFKLSTITAALNQDSMLVEGLLNADMVVSDFKQAIPTIDGTLQVDSIQYQQINVGNIDLKASSSNGEVTVSGKLDGNGNNVDLYGNYNADNIDVKLNLNPLSVLSIQPFTQGNLERSSGNITGPINISGAVSDPRWSGELNFNQVQTTAAQFGTLLKIDGQKISLQYPVITLNKFTVLDSTNNTLVLNGTITQNSRKEMISNLTVKADNFNLINNTVNDNPMIYGKAVIAVDGLIEGNLVAPELTGNVTVKNGTEVTYVKQTLPASLKARNELIEFVDMDTIANLLTQRTAYEVEQELAKEYATTALMQYNLNMEIEENARFNVIVDPSTRDELQLQGSGEFTVGSNPNGEVSIAGTYNLKGGSYQLNYGPVKRKFLLQEGSSVSLSGDPMNAQANITAIYEISTAPLDLIGNEVGAATATESQQYKRDVPFKVLLKINGSVAKPELSFDIVVKEKAAGISYELATAVENKLDQLRNDPSAMNKQVFALLALGRFVGDESSNFFGGNGTSSNLLANESVSGFLNAAVEQLAQNLIKGVDVDVNLKTVDDDPASQRTDLNVALGKTFLNDRLNVSFGKSFTIDGVDPSSGGKATSGNSQFMPDVNTTYKLSRDGKYMIRAYRRNQYEAIMDGYFIETGVAFSFTMSYDKFSELFRRKKK